MTKFMPEARSSLIEAARVVDDLPRPVAWARESRAAERQPGVSAARRPLSGYAGGGMAELGGGSPTAGGPDFFTGKISPAPR
jgi:hypothetical protein